MTTAALAKTGVEAVIEGLGNFESGFGMMNSLVDKFGKTASSSSGPLGVFGNILSTVGESLRRIGEFVVAGIILEGIKRITAAIRDMIGSVIDAAVEFQGLQIRLETFLAGDIMNEGVVTDFTQALEMAVPAAEELFDWIQQIALQTPFNTSDVANALTMARAWGFNTDEAKALTQQVIDFTAGMGLGGDSMDRVIKALGQMKSLGRVAGQELLQLANAGVPVAEIMDSIREELGLTTKEFEALKKKGGVSAEMFFDKWEELVNTRFAGSAIRASKTIKGLISNVRDLGIEVVGLNVVKPVLDVVADKFASIWEALTAGERGTELISKLKEIGNVLAGFVESLFGDIDAEGIADKLLGILDMVKEKIIGIVRILQSDAGTGEKVSGILVLLGFSEETVSKLSIWYTKIKEFIDKVKGVISGLMTGTTGEGEPSDSPIGRFFGHITRAIANFKIFWDENKEGILGAFKSILEGVLGTGEITGETILDIIGSAFENLSQKAIENGPTVVETLNNIAAFINDTFLPAWDNITTWIEENWETILAFFVGLKIGWEIIKAVAVVVGILIAALALLSSPFGALIVLVPILTGLIFAFWDEIKTATVAAVQLGFIFVYVFAGIIKGAIDGMKNALGTAGTAFRQLGQIIWHFVERAGTALSQLWAIARDAVAGFVSGFVDGIRNAWSVIGPWLGWLVDQIKSMLGISSPSTVFAEIGEQLNAGLAEGIAKSINLPAKAMDLTVQHVVSAGMSGIAGGGGNNNTTTNNFNMTVNSSARTEPIVMDFNTMRSVVGA